MKKKLFALFLFLLFSLGFAESWYVCVGSFTVERYAVNFCNELKAEGYKPFIEPASSKMGRCVYRVMIGEPSKSQNFARAERDEFAKSDFARRKNISGAWICQAPFHTAELSNPKSSAAPGRKQVKPKKQSPAPKQEESVQKNDAPSSESPSNKAIVLPPKKELPEEENVPPQENARAQEEENRKGVQVEEAVAVTPVVEKETEASEPPLETKEAVSESAGEVAAEESIPPASSAVSATPEKLVEDTPKQDAVQVQNSVFDEEINALPQSISKNVKVCLDRFPANKNFSLEAMKILDADNIRSHYRDFDERFQVPVVGEKASGGAGSFAKCIANIGKNANVQDGQVFVSAVGEEIAKSVKAFGFANYKDSSNKSVSMVVAVSEGAFFEEPLSSDASEKKDFSLKQGLFKSVISTEGANYILMAATENKKCFIKMTFENFTKDDVTAFMEGYNSDGIFSAYPQLKKVFSILPEDTKRDFLCYDMRKIEMDYVEQRGFVEWSMKMLGCYNASFTFNQDGKNVEVSVFDLEDEDNATDTHALFKEEQEKNPASGNSSQTIKSTAEAYLLNYGVRELSFAIDTLIVSLYVDADSALILSDLSNFAEGLKIWE